MPGHWRDDIHSLDCETRVTTRQPPEQAPKMLRAVSAVVAFVAASATLRSKVAANPAQPAW